MPIIVGRAGTIPAPVMGWDTETPVAELPPTFARKFENFLPAGVSVTMRKGRSQHASGLGDVVETLMAYRSGSASKLFGCAGANIYDVTSAGGVGAASLGSRTSARNSWVNFTTSGGSFLWICNGVDEPKHYDGSSWATPSLTITTFTDNDIFYVFESKQRLFFLFNNSLTFGYLPVTSIAGTVSNFALGDVFSRGGRLVAGARLAKDGGDGLDDYTVFLTSEGEMAIYSGSNPADANDWSKVGSWWIGRPIGDRPIFDIGGDLAILTEGGVVSALQIASTGDRLDPSSIPFLTARIATPFREAARVDGSRDGWQGQMHPEGDVLLINAPMVDDESQQFVRHRITGGWSRFTEWNMASLISFGGQLYGGDYDGYVHLLFDERSDGGEDIVGAISTPWSALGDPTSTKTMLEARAIVTTATLTEVRMVANMDYLALPPLPAWPGLAPGNAFMWDESNWDEALWGGTDQASRQWRAISGTGKTVSIVIEARASETEFSLNGFDVRFEIGGQV